MGKRRSSFEKASIAIAVTLIVIGVLWVFVSYASAGVTPVKIDVENDDELVSVKQDFTTITTQRLTIVAMEIKVEMFAGQAAEIEFGTSADFADAFVIDEKGEIIGSYEFARGHGDIEFPAGEKYTVIILSPGDDDNYGNNGDAQDFLRECKEYKARTKQQMIDIILGDSIEIAGSGDTAGVIVVKTKVVQPSIADISGEWSDDGDELEIIGQSNLPRRTEIEWKIFGETGVTKAKRNGKINFDIDLEGVDTSGNCALEMRVWNWYEEFEIDQAPESTEPVMSIKPKATPTRAPRPTLEPTPKPTLKPTPAPIITPAPEPISTPAILRLPAPTPGPTPISVMEVAREFKKKPAEVAILIIALVMFFAVLTKKRKK